MLGICKTKFFNVPSCFLEKKEKRKKKVVKFFKAEARENTTLHLIYSLMIMALQGNIISLCAGPNQDSEC